MKSAFKALCGVASIAILMTVVGCTGGKIVIKADKVNCPVSLTNGVYDQDFKLLSQNNYTIVHSFQFTKHRWSICNAWIPLSGNPNISEQLNKLVAQYGGDAIVNLKFATTENYFQVCSNVLIISGFIIPGTVDVRISGDIVKLDKK
jgi:hypothetical protein